MLEIYDRFLSEGQVVQSVMMSLEMTDKVMERIYQGASTRQKSAPKVRKDGMRRGNVLEPQCFSLAIRLPRNSMHACAAVLATVQLMRPMACTCTSQLCQ